MKNAIILSRLSIIAFLLCSCSKQEIELPSGFQDQNSQIEERSSYSVPSGWTHINSADKTGCRLYKKGSHYMQVIELDKGTKVRPYAYPVYANSNGEAYGSAPPASNSNPNPKIKKQTVENWWDTGSDYLPSTYKLYSVTNGTFFDYLSHPEDNCVYVCESVYPVKDNFTLKVCGDGGSPSDLNRVKRAFGVTVINGVQVPDVITFDDGASGNYYTYSNIYSTLLPYKWAIIGFKPSYTPDAAIYKRRTAIGTKSKNVYILTTTSATANITVSLYSEWGLTESKIVMLDGGGSTQLTVLNDNKIQGSRCIGSIIATYWGTE